MKRTYNMQVVGGVYSNPVGRTVTLCKACSNGQALTQAQSYNLRCSLCGAPLVKEFHHGTD